jgi:hypothetical protein
MAASSSNASMTYKNPIQRFKSRVFQKKRKEKKCHQKNEKNEKKRNEKKRKEMTSVNAAADSSNKRMA